MKTLKIIMTALLGILGAVSVFMTLSIILNLFGIREKEGNFVWFIVYTNLVCGILYLFAAHQLWKNEKRSILTLFVATVLLLLVFSIFLIYIYKGGVHETQTIYAMLLRTAFTLIMAELGFYSYKRILLTV